METAPQPEVFLTKESQKINLLRKSRKFFFIIIGILILCGVVYGIISYRNQIQKSIFLINNKIGINKLLSSVGIKPQTPSQPISQGKISDLINTGYPTLFYAGLEYDPKTGIVTQLNITKIKGDTIPYLYPNMPTATQAEFVYKVEVVSNTNNKIIFSGWNRVYKEIAQTKEGKIRFSVVTQIFPKSLVKVYLPNNKLIWTGEIS